MPTRHFIISGRVQGVGFRYATRLQAVRLGLIGWVCNRPDRTVEGIARGPDEALESFREWLHRGPAGARVDEVRFERVSSMPGNDSLSEDDFPSDDSANQFQIRR